MANLTAFYETKQMFIEATQYKKPLTFEEWCEIPDTLKSAVLFIQFYNEICGAWEKANAFDFIPGEDGVSTTLQYLEKNVSIILNKPERFKSAYIRTVAYNCQYCICHDLKSVKDRWENEMSNIAVYDEDTEVDLFDQCVDSEGSLLDVMFESTSSSEIWNMLEGASLRAQKVARYLISGSADDLKKAPRKTVGREFDPLADIEVAQDSIESCIEELKQVLGSANSGRLTQNLLNAMAV